MTAGQIAIVKENLEAIKAQFLKSNERKTMVYQELSKDKFSLEKVKEMKTANEVIPADSGYNDYDEWIEQLEKEITTSKSSLGKIEEQEFLVIAIDHFIDTM